MSAFSGFKGKPGKKPPLRREKKIASGTVSSEIHSSLRIRIWKKEELSYLQEG
jgi:hypothetical protein